MISPNALGSYWVQLETDAYRALVADDPTRLLLPVKIVPCEMPLLLRVYKWIDATAMMTDTAVQEIVHAVNEDVYRKSAPAQPTIKIVQVKWQHIHTKFTVKLVIAKKHVITTKIKFSIFPPSTVYQAIVDGSVQAEIVADPLAPLNPQESNFYIEGVRFIFGYRKFPPNNLSLEVNGYNIV